MELQNLTTTDCIVVAPQADTPEAIIRLLASRLEQAGYIQDQEAYIHCVMQREQEGPTALGEELAVPHGKSSAVVRASFALAILPQAINWAGLDGDEPVRLIFLLAIPPAEGGSTHIQLLTTLTSQLLDDSFRQQLMAASSPQQVFALLSETKGSDAQKAPLETQVKKKEKANWLTPCLLGVVSLAAIIMAGLDWAGYF